MENIGRGKLFKFVGFKVSFSSSHSFLFPYLHPIYVHFDFKQNFDFFPLPSFFSVVHVFRELPIPQLN